MGVYLSGMEMPTSCMLCPLCVEEADPANGEMCMVTGTLMPPCTRERLDNCPLVSVPPHGRLIDGDVAEAICFTDEDADGGKDFIDGILYAADFISQQPTIIEAEGET